MFGKKKINKLGNYTDPTGEFSNRELKAAEWYLVHKLLLKKIGYSLLIFWCVVSIGYSFGYWFYYYSYGYWQDERMLIQQTLELENYTNLQPLYSPQDLAFGRTEIYNSVSGELYDLVADVTNSNERWLAGVVYKFVYAGGETDSSQMIILPRSQQPLAYLGLKASTYPTSARLVIEEIKWRRLNPHVYADVAKFIQDRLIFSIDNFKFTSASRTQGLQNHMIEFEVNNASAYGFWEANFYLELIDGGGRAGLIYLPLEKLQAGEIRQIDLRSYVSGLRVTDLELVPLINIFDQEEYLPVSS